MPLHWQIDSQLRLVRAVGTGVVTFQDIKVYLDILERAEVVGWRKLIDARDAEISLTSEEVNVLGARLRAAHAAQTPGALAFILSAGTLPENTLRLLGFLAAARRSMRIFDDPERARRWIMLT